MKTLFERSFTTDELLDIDEIKDKYSHLVNPKIIDWFVKVDQLADYEHTQFLKWILEIYIHRKDRSITKETLLNMVQTAKDGDMLDDLVKCETYEEARELLLRFDTVEGLGSGYRSADEPDIIYEDHEWVIFKPHNSREVITYGCDKWEVADSNSEFENKGGGDGAIIIIGNKMSTSPILNFMIRSIIGGNISIVDGSDVLEDNTDVDSALHSFIESKGFHFNPSAREAILNLHIVKRKYNMSELRDEYERYERDSFFNDSWNEMVEYRGGWDGIMKYFDVEKFVDKYMDDLKSGGGEDDDLKSIFARSELSLASAHTDNGIDLADGSGTISQDGSEDLIDALIMSVPEHKLEDELGTKSAIETYDYLKKNYRSIDFDSLVDNLNYGYSKNLRDIIISKRPLGGTGTIETSDDLLRVLDVNKTDDGYDYMKAICKRLEDDYDFFSTYLDTEKMFEDHLGDVSDQEVIDWYEESGYADSDSEDNFVQNGRRRR